MIYFVIFLRNILNECLRNFSYNFIRNFVDFFFNFWQISSKWCWFFAMMNAFSNRNFLGIAKLWNDHAYAQIIENRLPHFKIACNEFNNHLMRQHKWQHKGNADIFLAWMSVLCAEMNYSSIRLSMPGTLFPFRS